jgi:hypothetical protein
MCLKNVCLCRSYLSVCPSACLPNHPHWAAQSRVRPRRTCSATTRDGNWLWRRAAVKRASTCRSSEGSPWARLRAMRTAWPPIQGKAVLPRNAGLGRVPRVRGPRARPHLGNLHHGQHETLRVAQLRPVALVALQQLALVLRPSGAPSRQGLRHRAGAPPDQQPDPEAQRGYQSAHRHEGTQSGLGAPGLACPALLWQINPRHWQGFLAHSDSGWGISPRSPPWV